MLFVLSAFYIGETLIKVLIDIFNYAYIYFDFKNFNETFTMIVNYDIYTIYEEPT